MGRTVKKSCNKITAVCSNERRGPLKHTFFKHLRFLSSMYIILSCFIDVLLQAQVLSRFQDKIVGRSAVFSFVRHRLLTLCVFSNMK